MASKHLVDESNVVRYCRPSVIHQDGTVGGDAFQLRPREATLSVHWLQSFQGLTKDQQLDEVRRLSRLRMSRNGRLAELRVGRVMQHVSSAVASLSFVHCPLVAEADYAADPSHSEICGLPEAGSLEAELVGEMIAACVEKNHPAVR